MKIQKKPEWLIIFSVHEARELVPYSEKLLKIIEESSMKGHSEVWVLFEKIKIDATNARATYELIVYQLVVSSASSMLQSIPLSEFGITCADKESWKKVLHFLYQNIQSERRMYFTWSHGAGFGINTGELQPGDGNDTLSYRSDQKEKDNEIIEVSDTFRYLSGEEITIINSGKVIPVIQPIELKENEYQVVKKGETFDCAKAEILWMSDFAQVLKTALQGNKVDILVMMNCNMQLFENGFLLRDIVKVLVGAETKMWAYGYDYKKILEIISNVPHICNKCLATSIVADYVAMHQQMGHDSHLSRNVMIANSLERYNNIAALLEETTIHLLQNWEKVKAVILKLRNDYFFSVSGREILFLLDIKLWIDTLFKDPVLALPYNECYMEFLRDIEHTVLAKHIGSELIKNDETGLKKYGASSSGLFFPVDGAFSKPGRFAWCEYFSGQRSSLFQEATGWGELIRAVASSGL